MHLTVADHFKGKMHGGNKTAVKLSRMTLANTPEHTQLIMHICILTLSVIVNCWQPLDLPAAAWLLLRPPLSYVIKSTILQL